mmetsp:Transcript_54399/g.65592  ORF Transcript_54399/g.65592 Transcript_54399/m.65592 type:complete len:133 (+) Transcript_54399:300-698(+)
MGCPYEKMERETSRINLPKLEKMERKTSRINLHATVLAYKLISVPSWPVRPGVEVLSYECQCSPPSKSNDITTSRIDRIKLLLYLCEQRCKTNKQVAGVSPELKVKPHQSLRGCIKMHGHSGVNSLSLCLSR